MCHPAAPIEMKRRSIFAHSVRRVPVPEASSSQRVSPYSSALRASTRVTFVSIGVGFPTQVSFTVPTAPRLPSVTKGAHSRSCAGSISACQRPGVGREVAFESIHASGPEPAQLHGTGRIRCVVFVIVHLLLPLDFS